MGVNLRTFGASTTASPSANSLAINSAISSLLSAGGGKLIVDAIFPIDSTVGISLSTDTSCKIEIVGIGGRRCSGFTQTSSVPVFQLKTTSGNIRDFSLRNLQLKGGTIGLDIKNDDYNIYDNVVFTDNSVHCVAVDNQGFTTSQFRSCWFLLPTGNAISASTGGMWCAGCVFGEGGGGFDVLTGATLWLDHCLVFDSSNKINTDGDAGEGNALFRVSGGSTLKIDGGTIIAGESVESVFYTDRCRDVMIEGCDIRAGQAANLIANRFVNTGTKPYPVLSVRPCRVSSLREAGITMYKQLDTGASIADHPHQDSLFDVGGTEYKVVEPAFSTEFTNAEGNVATIRARLDQD